MPSKMYKIKVLDYSYLSEFEYLKFRYLTYEVAASCKAVAEKKARIKYMKGEKELESEDFPFLIKTIISH